MSGQLRQFIFLVVSFTVGYIIIRFIRSKDTYRPEPVRNMIVFTVFGGCLSILLTYLTIVSLNRIGLYLEPINILDYFIFTGPIEELSKFFGFYLVHKSFKIEIEEPVDFLIYISCVALGFSLVENYQYAQQHFSLIFIRPFSSTVVHIVFSCLVGLAYYGSKNNNRILFFVPGFILAAVLHGIYNSWLQLNLGRTLIVFFIYMIGVKAVSYLVLKSPYYKNLIGFLNEPSFNTEKFCPSCQRIHVLQEVGLPNKIKMWYCAPSGVGHILDKNLREFCHIFIPSYETYRKKRSEWSSQVDPAFKFIGDDKFSALRMFSVSQVSSVFDNISDQIKIEFEKSHLFDFAFLKSNKSSNDDISFEKKISNNTIQLNSGSIVSGGSLIVLAIFLFYAASYVSFDEQKYTKCVNDCERMYEKGELQPGIDQLKCQRMQCK